MGQVDPKSCPTKYYWVTNDVAMTVNTCSRVTRSTKQTRGKLRSKETAQMEFKENSFSPTLALLCSCLDIFI